MNKVERIFYEHQTLGYFKQLVTVLEQFRLKIRIGALPAIKTYLALFTTGLNILRG